MSPHYTTLRAWWRMRKRGIALVLVLCFLLLISALILAFFVSIQGDNITAKVYSDGSRTKLLADSTVQMVMGQIRTATSQGSNIAWASQPGMIRTYGSPGNTVSGSPLANYKLYSSDTMVVSSPPANYDPSVDVDPQWDHKPSLYTDLNSPVANPLGGGTLKSVFPIVDPNAASGNPATSIAGFSYGPTVTVGGASLNIDGVGTPGSATQLPMPVKWLYQLRDGTLLCPDASTTNEATFTNSTVQPSIRNPIVARVAFWTDDETNKININTSAGDLQNLEPVKGGKGPWGGTTTATNAPFGSFWDEPRVVSDIDRALAATQPATNEFQRYPGHPASISLSTVFPYLNRDQIAAIAPRITSPTLLPGSNGGNNVTAMTTSIMGIDGDRMYVSLDELLFNSSPVVPRQVTQVGPGTTTLTKQQLEQVKFFLTPYSRAPEGNTTSGDLARQ